jgi:hypothetical protein
VPWQEAPNAAHPPLPLLLLEVTLLLPELELALAWVVLPPLLEPLDPLVCPLLLLPFPVNVQAPAWQSKPAQQSAVVVQLW